MIVSSPSRRRMPGLLVVGLFLAASSAVAAGETSTTLLLYRGEVAVVEQQRPYELESGRQTIVVDGLPPGLATGSVRVRVEDAALRSQQLLHRPATPEHLMEAHVGEEVQMPLLRSRRTRTVTVISADPPLVRGRHGVESVRPDDLIFPRVPAELRPDGQLLLDLDADSAGERDVHVSYVLSDIGWSVDYDAVVDVVADTVEITARATLSNRRNVAFPAARVGLIAGRLNLPDSPDARSGRAVMAMAAEDAAGQPEAVGDYYLYRPDKRVDVPAGGHITVPLFARRGADAERHYAVDGSPQGGPRPLHGNGDNGWQPTAVDARLSWRNAGGPMPAGTVRVYRRGADGEERLIGGGAVDDTPEDARVRLVPGRPFDITAERRQTDFRRVDDREHESAHEIRVRNARDAEVEVRVEARVRGDWEMLDSSDDWERRAADLVTWTVSVPAEGERIVSYRFRVRQ